MLHPGRRFKWIFWILALGLSGFTAAAYQTTSATDLLKVADEVTQSVVRLRGLQPKAPIQKGVKSREEISQYLNEHVRSDYQEGELEREGKMLQKLGLIPVNVDYKDFVLKLLTEQVGGFYDPDHKTFFMAGWLPVDQQKPVMAHELTHALQDQYFDLNKTLKEDLKLHDDDRTLAHQAIFEGDAMAVMLDFLLEPTKRNFAQLPDLVFVMRSLMSSMETQFTVFKSAPPYVKETLLVPYSYGAAFLQKVRSNQPWSAVDKLYSDLPSSTEQIIHPEKYLTTRDDPKTIQAPDLDERFGKPWQTTYRNVLGEFSLYLLLKAYLPEEQSKRAAAGWGGDQAVLLEEDGGTHSAVAIASSWDTPEDSQEFFESGCEWLQKRFPRGRPVKETPGVCVMTSDSEFNSVRQDGSQVRLILGAPEKLASKLKDW